MTASHYRSVSLVPVHVGQPVPTRDDLVGAANRANTLKSGRPSQRQQRFALVEPGVQWQKHGVEPRWLGMETSDCAAALDPSIFHSHGADELKRFLAGAGSRDETALVIATVGN